ncbi:probable peroxisomal membrane protein PEX13 [Simochromis diagramma]|uniref:probable peroxisomal membrane protein PEX13 n=1 Tax=Simochromis diagramma TaxID=43689 RepID=UPI001A7E5CC6|nr:probable peroxisomal membrane protein PEX13 [Simochromis diagramma]
MLCSINVAMNYGWILLIFYLYVVTKQIYRFGISYRLLHLRWLFCPAQDGAPGAPSSGLAVLLSIQQLLLPSYSPYGSSICGGHRPYSYSYGGGYSLGGYRHTPHLEDIPPADTNWASEEDNHVVARGEYDFTAASQEELSMRAGEMLNLAPKELQPRVRGWLLASVDGETTGSSQQTTLRSSVHNWTSLIT